MALALLVPLCVAQSSSSFCGILDLPAISISNSVVSARCSCEPTESGIGGTASCSMENEPVVVGSFTVLQKIKFDIGAVFAPCKTPAEAKVSASLTVPNNLPEFITTQIQEAADQYTEGTILKFDAADGKISIEEGVTAGASTAVLFPVFGVKMSVGALGLTVGVDFTSFFKLIVAVEGSVDNLNVKVSVDSCMKVNSRGPYCGEQIPNCKEYNCGSDCTGVNADIQSMCNILAYDFNSLFASPPYKILQGAHDFGSICPSLPTPGSSSGQEIQETYKVSSAVVTSGTVAEYTDEVKEAIASKIATLLGVNPSKVSVTVVPASVKITIEVDFGTDKDAADKGTSKLGGTIGEVRGCDAGTCDAVSSFFSTTLYNVTVVSVDAAATLNKQHGSDGGSAMDAAVIAGIAIACITGVCLCALGCVILMKKKSNPKVSTTSS
ncbi:hypothetical protein AB1Y20_012483 [Prymnesium parvum]|uniref:Uncharacterized protein n=1 Tax=Prymnesium parvum TaxID=97485 RepID=A0AB34ILI4_PRYPA